jgi:hypothetical protein
MNTLSSKVPTTLACESFAIARASRSKGDRPSAADILWSGCVRASLMATLRSTSAS